MPSVPPSSVIVVGGGVIGAACAYYLRRAGRPVLLIDQGEFGRGCSHGNCGLVCPSHVLPLAGPGALSSTLRTLFSRNSPLKVRWRFDLALWGWFWQFARKCNQRDMLSSGHGIQALLQSSRVLYDDLFHKELTDVEWETNGLLFVFHTPKAMNHYAQTDQMMREEFNLGATRYDGRALIDFEPAIKPGVAGAWHYATDAQLRPDKLMSAWRQRLTAINVDIRERCEVQGFLVEGRLVRGVKTSDGDLVTDQVVVATGAWTPKLHRTLKCSIPIQPGKGYSITMPRPRLSPRLPMIFEEHRVAITPMQSGYRIGSTMEFAGYDDTLNPDRLELLRAGAELYLHEPWTEPVFERWWGWRPMTPDSLPYIGAVPAFDNVFVAAGHGMLGVSMSPATGKLIAELLTRETPHVDPHPYRIRR